MIQDGNIAWIRKNVFFTAYDLQGLIDDTSTKYVVAAETSGVTQAEIASAGVTGFVMADGEFLCGAIPIPRDLDPSYPIGFRIHWTMDHDGSGNASASWIVQASIKAPGVAIAKGSGNLDTAITIPDPYYNNLEEYSVTDYLYQITDRGVWLQTSHVLTREQIETGRLLTLEIEMDAAENETSVLFMGLDMDYVPQKMEGQGSHTDRPLASA